MISSASSLLSCLSTFLLFHCTFFHGTSFLCYAEAPTTGIVAAAAEFPDKYGEKLAAAATAAADSAEEDETCPIEGDGDDVEVLLSDGVDTVGISGDAVCPSGDTTEVEGELGVPMKGCMADICPA